ncbi:hypothetical protein A4X03_0g6013 [Tilletia caries]|uniref:Protein-tyrosine-phosphatase n=1 Tax=Tilletia caries TaxID=13290 RepID=A0A177V9E3_9BASI|nr:hypothetical protein A4X03_0g6013 [Tilletia caries]
MPLPGSAAPGLGESTTIVIAPPGPAGGSYNNDDTESVFSHHQPGPPAPPPLLLPPPAFATVAPDIYRCSSSFPTSQDIANASVRDNRPQQQQQHLLTAQLTGSATATASTPTATTATANDALRADNKDPTNDLTATGLKHTQSSSSSSSPSPLRSPALPIPSNPSYSHSQPTGQPHSQPPSRPRSRVDSTTSSSAAAQYPQHPHHHPRARARARHLSALASAAALYAPFLDSLHLRAVLVLGWERPSKTIQRYCRDRGIEIVHLGLDGSRIGPPSAPGVLATTAERGRLSAMDNGGANLGWAASHHPGSLQGQRSPVSSAASSTFTPEPGAFPSSSSSSSSSSSFLASSGGGPSWDTGMHLPAPPLRPSSAASSMTGGSVAHVPNNNNSVLPPHPPPAAWTSSPALSSSASSSSSTSFSPIPGSLGPNLGSGSFGLGLTDQGTLGIPTSFGSHHATPITAAQGGANQIGSTMMMPAASGGTGAVVGTGPTVTGSLFAASASQAGLISERMVKDGLEIILDKNNHPVLIMDTSGIQETGVLVGCLRRMQRWDFASILVEYRSFAGTRSRVVNERFIEMYDTDLTTLPPMQDLPPFFAEHLAMDDEELDRQYGF